MTRKQGVPSYLSKKIKERDDFTCLKCGRHKNLEIHHIFPVYKGGLDIDSNLITLCSKCHYEAPDDPIEFFKYASRHLPPNLDKSKVVTKMVLGIIQHNEKLKELFNSSNLVELDLFFKEIDEIYKDLWYTFVCNDIDMLSKFLSKYLSNEEENAKITTSAK